MICFNRFLNFFSTTNRRSALRHRSRKFARLQLERLENKRLLAVDLAVTGFSANGNDLVVSYDVESETAQPFDIAIFKSYDGVSAGPQVGSIRISDGPSLTVGCHQQTISASFSDSTDDYWLMVRADAAYENAESNETNNEAIMSSGIFVSSDTTLHVHGSSGGDSITYSVNGSVIDVLLNETTEQVPSHLVSAVHVRSHGGADYVAAGWGFDRSSTVFAGDGADLIYGSFTNDYLDGGAGDDYVWADDGDDMLFGGNGADTLYAGGGYDYVAGGAGNDTLYGDGEADWLWGEDGDDTLYGGYGDDTLLGGNGDDFLSGDDGNDYIYGGDGNDYLMGGYGADSLYGDNDTDTVYGGDGDDYVYGGDGDDALFGDAGTDYLGGGNGNDLLYGGDGDDSLSGDAGNDVIYGERGNDCMSGGFGDDVMDGGADNDSITGEQGADTLHGGEGDDWLYAGDGDDTLYGDDGNDSMSGDEGNDTMYGGAGVDIMWGQNGDDFLQGDDGADSLYGGGGNDTLVGGATVDEILDAGWEAGDFVYDRPTIVDFKVTVEDDEYTFTGTVVDDTNPVGLIVYFGGVIPSGNSAVVRSDHTFELIVTLPYTSAWATAQVTDAEALTSDEALLWV